MQQESEILLQALYEGYQGALRAVAYRCGIPYDDIDDVIQDTFYSYIRAYEDKLPEWNEAQRKGVLMRILKNRCIDYLRRRKHTQQNVSVETGDFGEEIQLMDKYIARDIFEDIVSREDLRKVRDCIKEMKPAWREVAVLHFVEGRPLAEVSEILKINPATCRMRVSRIRKYLRKELGDILSLGED